MTESLLYLFLLLLILLVFGTAAYAGLLAAPWVPVWKKDIQRILKLANVRDNDLVYDLGSGDGRIVCAVANNSKAQVIGYEISVIPYYWSKIKILLLGLRHRVEIRYADFLKRDLSQATIIFCFLTPMAMVKLSSKFRRELKKGTKIISYSFSLPAWQPVKIDKPNKKDNPIFYYEVDASTSSASTRSA